MEQMKMTDHIADLLYKYTVDDLSDEERQELNEWVQDRPVREKYLQLLSSPQSLEKDYSRRKSFDVRKAIKEMEERIAENETPKLKPSFTTYLYRAAAVIAILLVGGTFWYRHHEYTRITPPEITEEVQMAMQQSVEKGYTAAEIISSVSTNGVSDKSSVISQEECSLYHVDDDFAEQLAEAKRVTTYRDKEFWVTLDDGTLVHLNYASRLIYPEKFGDRRDVILEGEAYFMVAKDKRRQFVVHTSQGDVKVYGTEFMVNTRDKDNSSSDGVNTTSVVLIKGSVGFTTNRGNETMMLPGQQLTAYDTQLTLRQVDTAPYTAWNEGDFIFKEWTLERIMSVISLWYGLQIDFADSNLKNLIYSGSLSRYADMKPTIEAIEMVTGMTLTVDNHTLFINNK